MRKNITIALLLAVCAIALTHLLHQIRATSGITPVEMERLIGAGLAAGLGSGDAAGVLVVADEIEKGIPDYSVRLDGLTEESVRLGFPKASLSLEKWPVDPMHRQAGRADFFMDNLLALVDRHPGIKHVVLMLDLASPTPAERQAAHARGLIISLLTNNDAVGRQLHQDGVARTVFLDRITSSKELPRPPFQDKKYAALNRRFVILTAP